MNMMTAIDVSAEWGFRGSSQASRQALVMIVSDSPETVRQLRSVCEFFDLAVEAVCDESDLMAMLREHRPMAVVTDIEGADRDGFHAMKIVANYDRHLPMLLLTGGDPVLMGAADAVQEMWQLSMVSRTTQASLPGQIAEFLFSAGRKAGCMRLVRV
jgi:CheY-like chemotaxis protein